MVIVISLVLWYLYSSIHKPQEESTGNKKEGVEVAAGWNLSHGDIKKYYVSEDELWAAFNYVFSESWNKL